MANHQFLSPRTSEEDVKVTPSSNLKIPKIARQLLKALTEHSPGTPFSLTLIIRMFGRTIRLEPATGSRKAPGSGDMGDRPRRFDSQRSAGSSASSGGYREYSTFRPALPGFLAVRRPVALNQVNALVGRRMFGLAASIVLKRRVV